MKLRTLRNSGFTLVEVMVAMAVFILMALAAGEVMLSTHHVGENDAEFTAAMTDLKTIVEAINGTPFDNIVPTYPNNQVVTAYSGLHLNNESVTVSYVDPAATNPLQITSTITWTGSDATVKTLTLSGMRVR